MKRIPMGPPPLRLVASAAPDSMPDLMARLRTLRAKFAVVPEAAPLFEACSLAAGSVFYEDSAKDALEGIAIANGLAADAPAEVKTALSHAKENAVSGESFAAMAHAIEAATLSQYADALRLHERWVALGRPELRHQSVRSVRP
jgi:hypothetical protein